MDESSELHADDLGDRMVVSVRNSQIKEEKFNLADMCGSRTLGIFRNLFIGL